MKRLAEFAVNVGVKCGHGCTYCSSSALLRCHPAFHTAGKSAFQDGYAIIDPTTPERVAHAARSKRKRGLVQLCTTVDAWCPAAQRYDLGRRCLEAILSEPGWTVRILTKNAAVVKDYDLIERYRDRVLVGISLTAPADRSAVLSVVEPNASPIEERMAAMEEAHRRGLRTYGRLCPLLPEIGAKWHRVHELMGIVQDFGVEEVFVEPVNSRGNGLLKTEKALRQAGYNVEADAIGQIRNRRNWSAYATQLINDAQNYGPFDDSLRILVYPGSLTPDDRECLELCPRGIVWLDDASPETPEAESAIHFARMESDDAGQAGDDARQDAVN